MTILDRVLAELRAARQPVSTSEISHRLGIDPSALTGMLATLEASGTLVGDSETGESLACGATGGCAMSCSGIDRCAFIVRLPSTQRLMIGSPTR